MINSLILENIVQRISVIYNTLRLIILILGFNDYLRADTVWIKYHSTSRKYINQTRVLKYMRSFNLHANMSYCQ